MNARPLFTLSPLLAAALAAQTTGTPGINDLTVNNFGSGTASCQTTCFPTPNVLSLDVSTATGNVVVFVFSFCVCGPCQWPWPSNACTPAIPISTCTNTNQSFDLFLAPFCATQVVGTAFAVGGVATLPFPVPLMPLAACTNLRTSFQAIVIDPCGVGGGSALGGPFVLTQAINVHF